MNSTFTHNTNYSAGTGGYIYIESVKEDVEFGHGPITALGGFGKGQSGLGGSGGRVVLVNV